MGTQTISTVGLSAGIYVIELESGSDRLTKKLLIQYAMKKTGITRKQAIKKMGKYAALTAIGTFAILNPKKAQAQSTPPGPPGWD